MDGFGSGDRGYKREAGGGAVTLGCSAPQAGDLHLKTGRWEYFSLDSYVMKAQRLFPRRTLAV